MLIGCYYRCPAVVEKNDVEYPRLFVLAQAVQYHEISEQVKVRMHDLLGSGAYYRGILEDNVFRASELTRCEACPGSEAFTPLGFGQIVTRVKTSAGDSEPYWYWVRLADGSYEKFCETELQIEYSQMNFSPLKQLKNYEFQHPTWFINRLRVRRNLHLVNNATYGFSVLAGCRAYLLPHQISTVTRCLETMPVRYMLADEVGLGKTIEACSILSIMVHDNQELRTIIIVPQALVGQWRSELRFKFNLESEVMGLDLDNGVCIVPLEQMQSADQILQESWDLAVIDETHRLLSDPLLFEQVQDLSRRVEHILLLSATPIQDRNEEYHRLLALLSPDQYGGMSPDDFAALVAKQENIQGLTTLLIERLDEYDKYHDDLIERLKEIAEVLKDPTFKKLVRAVEAAPEESKQELIRQAVAYVCENFRLERRVIRNRRALIQEQMAQRTLHEIRYTPLTADDSYDESSVIRAVLNYLTGAVYDGDDTFIQSTAIPLLSALFSSPWALEKAISTLQIKDRSLIRAARTWKHQAELEMKMADYILDIDPDQIKGRLLRALDFIEQESGVFTSSKSKIVVFTSFPETLDAFMEVIRSRCKRSGTGTYPVPFCASMSRDDLETSVYSFQNDPNCQIIVCDETGGEGRNFQNADLILHLDVPWTANALEQRIGRLDRLGRDPSRDVLSAVLYTKGTVEEQLVIIWRDALEIFTQSLSGLEIITGELSSLIAEALEDDFETGLANALKDIKAEAEDMRDAVEDEQDFDLGVTLYRPLNAGVTRVLDVYASDSDSIFAAAMLSWGNQVGLASSKSSDPNLLEFSRDNFSVKAAKQALFVPPDWDGYEDSAIMRRERKILGTFDRKTAALREDVLFFAPGDSLYDSIIANAVGCSRGRCTAVEIPGRFNYVGLVFIYDVEPRISNLLQKGIGLQTLSQYRMFLPLEQIVIPVGLNELSRNTPDDVVKGALYAMRHKGAVHLGRRSAPYGQCSNLQEFITKHPVEKWEQTVERYAKLAYERAVKEMNELSDIPSAKKEMERVLNGLRAECTYFGRSLKDFEEKRKIYGATYSALSKSRPVLDAVCYLRVRKI